MSSRCRLAPLQQPYCVLFVWRFQFQLFGAGRSAVPHYMTLYDLVTSTLVYSPLMVSPSFDDPQNLIVTTAHGPIASPWAHFFCSKRRIQEIRKQATRIVQCPAAVFQSSTRIGPKNIQKPSKTPRDPSRTTNCVGIKKRFRWGNRIPPGPDFTIWNPQLCTRGDCPPCEVA